MQNQTKIKELDKVKLLELNEAYRKCLFWFFSYPNKEMSFNDLATNLRVYKNNIRKIVFQLIEDGFLIKEELGKVWRIFVNKDHFYNKTIKICHHLEQIYLNFPNILQEIYKKSPNPLAIILFGSYRKGDDNENSDIDIAIEIIGNKDPELQELRIPQLGYRKNVRVNLYKFSRNRVDLNIFNNIANGIILDGFLEVKP